jgi:D-amino-acid dehydrogenase
MGATANVVVIGAGVIGLACAYELRRRGATVTVVDAGEPEAVCSAGNLGWIVPSFSEPLPTPDVTATSLRWMLRGDSPLYIRPATLVRTAPWLWMFWRHCNAADYRRGLESLARLNHRTMAAYDAWGEAGIVCEMHRTGVLFVFQTARGMQRTLADLEEMASLGFSRPTPVASGDLRDVEPAWSEPSAGGIMVEGERHVRPESLLDALKARLHAMGVEIRHGMRVSALVRRGPTVAGVMAAGRERLQADAVVIAAGAWSGLLARSAGIRLPIQAGKGYTVTVTDPALRLRRPLYLGEARLGLTPFGNALRIGGTMELSGVNIALDERRVNGIMRTASRFLPGWERGRSISRWVGARPLTPDGLPVIGRAPGVGNLFVATGHGMLGITLAPATGLAIADLLAGGSAEDEYRAFAPDRFA